MKVGCGRVVPPERPIPVVLVMETSGFTLVVAALVGRVKGGGVAVLRHLGVPWVTHVRLVQVRGVPSGEHIHELHPSNLRATGHQHIRLVTPNTGSFAAGQHRGGGVDVEPTMLYSQMGTCLEWCFEDI